MKTVEEARIRFTKIVDSLTGVIVETPDLDADLLTRTAASQSHNLAGLEQELRAMRTSLPNGLEVWTPDYEELARLAEANGLGLKDIQDGAAVDETDGRVIRLQCKGRQISDPAALARLISLQELDLPWNGIQDISALAGLTSLKVLTLDGNQIRDLSALSGMTSLKELHLFRNLVQDLSPLSELVNLEWLGVSGNQIHEISALSGLTSLKTLFLSASQIQDISALSSLTSLQHLMISRPGDLRGSAATNFDEQIAALRDRNVSVQLI